MKGLSPNENLNVDVQHLGQSREPLLSIDDFTAMPQSLIDFAANKAEWSDMPPGGYPGQRAALPSDYVRETLQRLDPIIRDRLFAKPMKLDRFECSLSMVTKTPAELADQQKLPHIDIARGGRVAILHYLCGSQFGGTAFFRQKSTGLEQVPPESRTRFLEARATDLKKLNASDSFPNKETRGYDQIGQTEVAFNRLVIYRSFTLHSGIIGDSSLLSKDPRTGRLTANFFVDYVATDQNTQTTSNASVA